MTVKDIHGNVLDEWPKCIVCGTGLGWWEGDRYFCQHINCSAHGMPQEWICTVEKDGDFGWAFIEDLDKVKALGYKVVRLGVGAKVVE